MVANTATDLSIETQADGSVVIDLHTHRVRDSTLRRSSHDENLGEVLDQQALSVICSELIEGIEADEASRTNWVQNYNDGLRLLGILLEKGGIDSKTSKVRHPLLMQAVTTFQASTRGEMLPVGGPVKVDNTDERNVSPQVAEALEEDSNYFYTQTASEYYPDTDRGLFYLGYGGTIFKKVYRCPIRRRPVSETVYLTDLVISNDTTDIPNAARVTHLVPMSRNQIRQMVHAGYFADLPVMSPTNQTSTTATAIGQTVGVQALPRRQEDFQHRMMECYCRLDLGRWDSAEPDQDEGVELPYRVTMDRDSRQIFEMRRNWREADETRQARRRFVKWGLVPGIGYLDLGYLNLLGNHALALTALERILIDSGIYSIFPGGVRKKGMRIESNEIRPGPGEFPELDTGGEAIQTAIMALPFKGPTQEVLALLQHLEAQGEKSAGKIDIPTGTGLTNVPVGTIIAAIDQQAQPEIAVHQRLHTAQGEEFSLMQELFAEDEESFLVLTRGRQRPYTREMLVSAKLTPASDPNTPARVHRVMQATVLESLSTSHPTLYNQRECQKRILDIAKIYRPDEILMPILPPAPAPPDPTMAIAQMQSNLEQMRLQVEKTDKEGHLALDRLVAIAKAKGDQQRLEIERQKAQAAAEVSARDSQARSDQSVQETQMRAAADGQASAAQLQADMENAEADRLSRERIAAMNDQTTLIAKGIEQLGQETSPEPARDTKAGP